MSMAISGPAGRHCTVHNNMEWWARQRRKKGERGRQWWGGCYSLTLWHFCHQLQCLSLSLTHTHTHTHWGLRPCTGTWKFSLQFSVYPKVTCYKRSHNTCSEHNLLSYLSWTNILISWANMIWSLFKAFGNILPLMSESIKWRVKGHL